jgi:TRAP-type mannitol/chloroaromatic compound transport system permease small subunit
MSQTPQQDPDAPDRARRTGTGPVAAAWNLLVDGLGALGTVLIGVLMIIICADVVARNFTGGSLPMISEAGALTLVMIVYLQLATTIRHDRLARTDLFLDAFKRRSPRGAALLMAVFDLTAAAALGVIAWSTVTVLERDFSRGEYIGVTGIATLPTWPFRALILLGISVAAVQCMIQVLGALRRASGKGTAK